MDTQDKCIDSVDRLPQTCEMWTRFSIAGGKCNKIPYWICCRWDLQQFSLLILLHFQSATKSLTDFVAFSKCNKIAYWLILLHFQNATKSVRDFVARCLDQCSIMPKGKRRKILKKFQFHMLKSSLFDVKTLKNKLFL